MRDSYIILIVGKSGSGKSTLAKMLEDNYGLREVKSYTTRPCRGANDTSHIFVTRNEFKGLDICAYTLYNGNEYGATNDQVNESDIDVIDPNGVEYFLEHYTGRKVPIVICIEADKKVRKKRLKERGDKAKSIRERIDSDEYIFRGIEECAFKTFTNNDSDYKGLENIATEIYNMFFREKGEQNGT